MSLRRWTPLIIYLLACAFYLYEFVLQVAPSVMVNELMQELHLDSVGIAGLAAAYYYAYAPMQIPAGILFDRFGPRRLICFATILCVIGTFLFAKSDTIYMAAAGRFMVGIGSAFSFVGILVLISNWFEDKYYALLIGLAQLLSSLGVISGQYLLAHYILREGWRVAMMRIALAGLALALATWFLVKDKPDDAAESHPSPKASKLADLIESFVHICRRSQTWYVGLYAFVIWGPMTFFSSLWAVQYLKVLYGISTRDAISYEMVLWIGVAVGCPLMGALSNIMGRRVLPMILCSVMGLVASSYMISFALIPGYTMVCLLFLIGVSAAGQTVSFGLVRDNNLKQHLGSASGFNNMATVAGGAILQPIMGVLIKFFWTGKIVEGAPFYELQTYQSALILLPICYSIALILTLFSIKESYCQPID